MAKFLAEEPVAGQRRLDLLADERFHVAVGDGDDVLQVALGLDDKGIAPVEIIQCHRPALLREELGEGEAFVEGRLLRRHAFIPCNGVRY